MEDCCRNCSRQPPSIALQRAPATWLSSATHAYCTYSPLFPLSETKENPSKLRGIKCVAGVCRAGKKYSCEQITCLPRISKGPRRVQCTLWHSAPSHENYVPFESTTNNLRR